MNKFKIGQTVLEADLQFSRTMTISSHPQPYVVEFTSFDNRFTQDQVVLVDRNVQQLYNIRHSKMIIIEAQETNKSIATVLNICEQLMGYEFDKGSTLVVIGGGIIHNPTITM